MNWAPLLRGGGAALKRGALIAGHLQHLSALSQGTKLGESAESLLFSQIFQKMSRPEHMLLCLPTLAEPSRQLHKEEPFSKFCHS